jgi:hypothetical protein
MASEDLTDLTAKHFETNASENATGSVVNGSCLCDAVKYNVTGRSSHKSALPSRWLQEVLRLFISSQQLL